MDRRTLVRVLGTAGLTGIAGCSAQDNGTETASPSPVNTEMTQNETPTAEETAVDDGLVTVSADESVEATVDRISGDIEDSPLTLLTTVDHASNAASADEDLPPTTLLIFGNPSVGTPLMRSARSVAIDLPQKMLVWEDDGETRVTYNDPEYLAQRHGIDGQSERLAQISSILDQLATGGG
jgi:uncharacterized protein (DUF302 family)